MKDAADDSTFDVIVVGGGGAGLAAATQAAESGARTVLLEKNPQLGGSTIWSIGSVTATGTPHQRRRGIEDNPADHHEDMALFAGALAARDNAPLRKVLCDAMPATFQWLLDSGIRFQGPMAEPPHRLPRMHNVLPNSRAFIYHLERRARRAGVDMHLAARVESLVLRAERVEAVKVATGTGSCTLTARRGIVLAAGDFTNSPELKRRFMGLPDAEVEGVNPTATGDGQLMAEAIGAQICNGDLALGPEIRFIAPAKDNIIRRLPPWPLLATAMRWAADNLPPTVQRPLMMKFLTTALAPTTALFNDGARLINAQGDRFGDETDSPARRVAAQPGKIAYILFDARIAQRYSAWPHFISTAPGIAYAYLADYRRNRRDVFHEAPTVAALAAKLGMDPLKLQRSAGANPHAERLAVAPFVALGPVRSVFVHSEGGLLVDTSHRVLDRSGLPIGGLFAAGATGQGGLLLQGHGHHLAWAFASGLRAGRNAASSAFS